MKKNQNDWKLISEKITQYRNEKRTFDLVYLNSQFHSIEKKPKGGLIRTSASSIVKRNLFRI